jgi:hypothetical protein
MMEFLSLSEVGMDFDLFLFLDHINVLSTEVYYDVLDTGGSSFRLL